MKLRKLYGDVPPLNTVEKQKLWVTKMRDKRLGIIVEKSTTLSRFRLKK